jgi:fructose-1,6-bisphosphatase/inositol monophosphatase family enzyme
MIRNHTALLAQIRAIHASIRDAVVAACEQTAIERLAAPVAEEAGDTIFAIDRVSEDVLLERFDALAEMWPCVLIAEGLGATGRAVLPRGANAAQAELRIIVDPIDGTRGLMYQKRPAWILTGVAPNNGPLTCLADVELAVMTEIPLVKQHLSDSLWAAAGHGAAGERLNRLTGERVALRPQPSRSSSIAQGYGGIARFFPGARDALAAIEEELIDRVLGPQPPGTALAFEDQYISTGGQLYELIMGHDRWIADLRPLAEAILQQRGKRLGLCCHPYDLCTELVARETGVLVTDARGHRLDAPLDVISDVAWIGYANPAIFEQVAPILGALLVERGLLVDPTDPR